jgi:hypothetical protein
MQNFLGVNLKKIFNIANIEERPQVLGVRYFSDALGKGFNPI